MIIFQFLISLKHSLFLSFIEVHVNYKGLEKTCLHGVANNTGVDQPVHPRSLISTFVIHFLESTISKLATGEISIF